MIAFNLVQGMFRSAWYSARALRHRLRHRLRPEDWDQQMKVQAVQEHAPDAGLLSPATETEVPAPEAAHESRPGQVLIRYGEGFSVVSHFYRSQSRVVRVIWLDYGALKRRHGAFVVRRLRLRAGEAGARHRRQGSALGGHPQGWGRIALPDELLQFESLQDLCVVRLMERSLDEATQLIEAEIPDNLLNKKPWRLLPPCVAPGEASADLQKRTVTLERTMEEIRSEDSKRKMPMASEEKIYPNLVKPPVVTQHSGLLRKTGYVERIDPSGRKYRTFFAELEDEVQTVRHTGVDLQRALLREEVNIGDRVEVFTIGLVPTKSGQYKKKIWSARKLTT